MKNLNYLFLLSLLFIKAIYADSCALFRQFPAAQKNLAYKTFCDLPTPITQLKNLGQKLYYPQIYLKRDDLAGSYLIQTNQVQNNLDHAIATTAKYGCNKVRKLEWLIADALNNGAHTVLTYGCAGSNHALATTMYAQACGLKTILMLLPQPNSCVVRQNLLMNLHLGAQMHCFATHQARELATQQILASDPGIYFIPTGGSNEIGSIGYVSAIFELCEQISAQTIQTPDLIYLPMGSCGTTAGILLGLALSKLNTKIIAVAVEPEPYLGFFKQELINLFHKTNLFLNSKDPKIALVDFPENQLIINQHFGQSDYGEWTQTDYEIIRLIDELEKINLEGTYSSKTFSALIHDLTNGYISPNQTILIWQTYCGLNFNHAALKQHDYHELPAALHAYFEKDLT